MKLNNSCLKIVGVNNVEKVCTRMYCFIWYVLVLERILYNLNDKYEELLCELYRPNGLYSYFVKM